MTLFKELDSYVQLEKDIKQRFKEAEKRSTDEVATLTSELESLQAESRELYTMYVLGDITKDTYDSHLNTVKEKQLALASVQKVLSDIDDLQKEEIAEKVFNPMQGKHRELRNFISQARNTERKKVLQAKIDYINAILEAKKEIEKGISYDSFMERVSLEQGKGHGNYVDLFDRVGFLASNEYNGTAGADMSYEELHEIYNSGKMPKKLVAELEK